MNSDEMEFCKSSRAGKSIRFRIRHSRFESSRPSHPFLRSARLPKRRENGPEIRAFRAFAFVSGPPVCRGEGGNGRKSPAFSANIPVLERLLAETGLITTAARARQCNFLD
jgi:hypothetical protein